LRTSQVANEILEASISSLKEELNAKAEVENALEAARSAFASAQKDFDETRIEFEKVTSKKEQLESEIATLRGGEVMDGLYRSMGEMLNFRRQKLNWK
jgi:predicted  nucleic acid-binding Zn-ribbon protein